MKRFLIINFYRIVNQIRIIYWFIFRPCTRGVKSLIEHKGKFLLVRVSYTSINRRHFWTIPGGGVMRDESFEQAAIRETKEEVGIDISGAVYIGEYESRKQYKKDLVKVFIKSVSNYDYEIDDFEIVEAKWFSVNDIPSAHDLAVDYCLEFYNKHKNR